MTQSPKNENGVQGATEISIPSSVRLRSLAICGPISDDVPLSVMRALLALEAEDPKAPIVMFINTPGGNVYDAFAIYDVMKEITCPIITMGFGRIMSAGTLVIAAGTKGMRYALPNSYFMMHDMQCVQVGVFTDVEAQHKHTKELRDKYIKLLSQNSKVSLTKIKQTLIDKETYFNAQSAKDIGIIDHITFKRPKAFLKEL